MTYNEFLLRRYEEMLGSRFKEFLEASRKPLPKYIRVNTLRIKPKELRKRLEEKGFELKKVMDYCFLVKEAPISIGATTEYLLGYYFLQDYSSLFPAINLNPKPGEVVWDMCAAPGGKTTHLAQLMKNQGVIVATDVRKVKSLWYNVMRMGVTNVIIYQRDAREVKYKFDKILLDAPCTGTGILRRDPTRARVKLRDIRRASSLQKELMKTAYENLKEGGTLVYSTCSLEPEENEEVVEYALSLGFELKRAIGGEEGLLEGTVRIWPFESSGFFIAKLVRPCE